MSDLVEEPKPFVPVFVVANDVRAIDSAIQDVLDAFRNLNVETSGQGVILGRGRELSLNYGTRAETIRAA